MVRRAERFVWVTWLTRLMVGEASCEWAAWFRTNYERYTKAPSDFDSVTWNMQHTRLLRELREEREQQGDLVYVEKQNQFYYRRPSTGLTVSGKPDLVAISGQKLTVYDAKTGQPRDSDQVQVMVYMHCLQMSVPRYRDMRFHGVVVYPDRRVDVPASTVNDAFVDQFHLFLDVLEAESPARKVPSASECRFCDIAREHCPERVDAPQQAAGPDEP